MSALVYRLASLISSNSIARYHGSLTNDHTLSYYQAVAATGEPLPPADARALIKRILQTGGATWDTSAKSHFLREMAADGLVLVDCINVLRGGVPAPAEWNDEYEEFRYCVRTNKICVVVTFTSDEELFIVTTWRNKS